MRLLLVLLLCSGCAMQLRAQECKCSDHSRQVHKLMETKCPCVQAYEKRLSDSEKNIAKLMKERVVTKQVQAVKQVQVAVQEQVSVTKKTYGSMKKPYKTITIDVYQETDVKVEQRQKQIAALIAQLKQLQESKVEVEPKIKVVVR